jgi:hypothetical protein
MNEPKRTPPGEAQVPLTTAVRLRLLTAVVALVAGVAALVVAILLVRSTLG